MIKKVLLAAILIVSPFTFADINPHSPYICTLTSEKGEPIHFSQEVYPFECSDTCQSLAVRYSEEGKQTYGCLFEGESVRFCDNDDHFTKQRWINGELFYFDAVFTRKDEKCQVKVTPVID